MLSIIKLAQIVYKSRYRVRGGILLADWQFIYQNHSFKEFCMAQLTTGVAAPDFAAMTDSGDSVKLSDYQGQKVVLYFYPKDDTPG